VGNQDIGRKGFLAIQTYSIREDAKANNFSATEIEVANALSAVWAGEQSHHAQTFIASAPIEEGLLSFPSRFGSNADVTEDITQSFAHSAGAPAVFRKDETAQSSEGDDEFKLLPQGLDSHRYRVAGNGVVAPVAEFIGRRLVGVDAKWFKKEVEG
jgi:hypothetical protein